MKGRLLLFGGTTEARELLASGVPALCSVATAYGASLMENLASVTTVVARMDAAAMTKFIRDEGVTCVIDATHPYAVEVTENIKRACRETCTPLLRVLRDSTRPAAGLNLRTVSSCEEAARLVAETNANVLLTVGSKELEKFTGFSGWRERLFARVLPLPEVISRCTELGFDAGHIIAMQGPFSEELNEAFIKMTKASVLVTKDGGPAGGTKEKFDAAVKTGAAVILVKRKETETGFSVEYAVRWARERLDLPQMPYFPMWIDLRGKTAVVVGGGEVALRRARTLKKCGAVVKVVSPVLREEFADEGFETVRRKWEARDLDGAFLAVAATNDRSVNREIGAGAKAAGIPVSVADERSECTFLFPSFVAEGDASVSVSTGGGSPQLVRRLADRLREVWPAWVAEDKQHLQDEEGEKQ
jgi:precorrin-6A/cobalt-precorrin-6A reductase